jgi:hypothetical protein
MPVTAKRVAATQWSPRSSLPVSFRRRACSSAITTAAQNAAVIGRSYGRRTDECPWCAACYMPPYKSEDVEEGDDD